MTTETAAPQTFSELPLPLAQSLRERGFTSLTKVQQAVSDALIAGGGVAHNLRISSQTGSGKTVALGLALSPALLAERPQGAGPLALVITPTRELAVQVQGELAWLYAHVPSVTVDAVTGGTDVRQEKYRLRQRAAVLVGTPGRLLDHIRSGALDCSSIRNVVLDEADQMLDLGFKDELDAIVEALPAERHSHLVSATFSSGVEQLARKFQGEALRIEGTTPGRPNSDIEHVAYLIQAKQVYGAIVNLLLQNWGERTLLFVQRRSDASELAEKLAGDGFAALPLSGDLPQAQRTRTLNAFRTGTITTLIATDVAARGIDVPDISTVIHVDPPNDPDVYVHRSGRTGRAGRTGRSLLLVPAPSRGRVERVLKYASVQARWEPVPSPKTIRQSFTKTTRRLLFKNLETECNESELTYARGLLEKQDPAKVIATLLRMAEPHLPREPFEILPPAVAPRPIASHGPRPAAAPHQFARFRLTWGANQGATANRALSHVCRRGGITKQAVGAIEVNADSTVVEVAASEALRFERRVRLPDPRDPDVQIVRDDGGSRAAASPRASGGGGFPRLRPKTSRGPFPGRPARGPHGSAREGRPAEPPQDTFG